MPAPFPEEVRPSGGKCTHIWFAVSASSSWPKRCQSCGRRRYPKNGIKKKVWLTADHVVKMLRLAAADSARNHLMLLLMRWGLRCGEIVGWRGLPGIRAEDIREEGIWIKGKGYSRGIVQDILVPMPPHVMRLLKRYASEVPPGSRIFPLSEPYVEELVKNYAKNAGVEDWERVGPHRLRAFFATDAKERGTDGFTIRDLMRHKNQTTTEIYVGRSTPGKLAKVVNALARMEA